MGGTVRSSTCARVGCVILVASVDRLEKVDCEDVTAASGVRFPNEDRSDVIDSDLKAGLALLVNATSLEAARLLSILKLAGGNDCN